LDCYG